MSTQLSEFATYDVSRTIFSQPETGSISNSLPKISFKRIRINTQNPDGSIGDLILSTPVNLMCFGMQENRDMTSGAINGYSFPICLWNRNGATPEEKLFVEKFNGIVEFCKTYLVENRDTIEKYDLEINDLKKFNPLFWKMDKGKIVEGRGPMLYAKVMVNKKNDNITTTFINDETNELINPMELLNKRCFVTAALKIESIFVGNKISLQVKLFESVVRMMDTSFRTFLRPTDQIRIKKEEDDPCLPSSGQEDDQLSSGVDEYYPVIPSTSTKEEVVSPAVLPADDFDEEEDMDEEEEYIEDATAPEPAMAVSSSSSEVQQPVAPSPPLQNGIQPTTTAASSSVKTTTKKASSAKKVTTSKKALG